MDELFLGVIVANVLEWVKDCKKIPWINHESDNLNRIVAIVIAIFSGIGLHFAFDAGAGSFTITGLTTGNVAHSIYDVLKQYICQQGTYKLYIKKQQNEHNG